MLAASRRNFLQQLSKLGLSSLFISASVPAWSRQLEESLSKFRSVDAERLASEEDFWYSIQQAYTVSPSIINLNNGGVSPSPKVVQDAMKRYHDLSNEGPSYFMWRILDQGREPLRANLARLAGCDPEELAIQRNASEALETAIFGIPLRAGDEVVLSKQDYPNMINAWKQREKRDGIKLVWINLDLPSEDNDYLTQKYVKAFTNRTRVVHITHIINWNGQILPVRTIAGQARARGIEVLVDGAHSFAHFQFRIDELGADYFGTSLHKWLSACIGTGFLYVRKEKIENLYPLFGAPAGQETNIRKFENLGTRPFFIEQAIGKAIEFQEMIGSERKEKRLHYLKNYWMEKVEKIPGVELGTSLKPGFACAIGLVAVKNRKPAELDQFLFNKYKIHTVGIEWENIKGVRITPHVYTTTRQLDTLVQAITEFAKT
ncbi:aminotransferase class V-fold PLP-dependent enzyme [Flavihumibacter cheonanensis]|uniref:aminotransferase class V-fold PLP-dependent enzyme n=1 Tax=Flavihumibacter cheonanensis TaxID=1442385 RepID=UPI001EF9936F|nr:aminotransferase class V-fold PLP-dependent enzyme [Flavihumibacter cheonanensis]MCG7750816.1 aminotransferase class V-fold PLP-dependent enzyme [Flavihumibacter cheonanensis]